MSVFQQFLDEVGISRQQPNVATPIHLFPYKNRTSLIGTVGAGKSAVVSGIVMRAEARCADRQDFYCRVLEGSSEIHQDVSDMRDGHFPRKTTPFGAFASEAGLLLENERRLGVGKLSSIVSKNLRQVPICDIAGEDISQMIRQVRAAGALGEIAKQAVRNLIAYVRESDAHIITLKATRAKGLFDGGRQLEEEADAKVSRDPDVNLVRLLEDLMNYKATHRSRPVRGVAVVITAWDRLKASGVADKIGFDILNPMIGQNDLQGFVQGCFPSTFAAIKSLRVPNVQYFPSFFEVETDEQGNELRWPDNSPKIKHRQPSEGNPDEWFRDLRGISYSEASYDRLIDWILTV